MKSHTLVAIVAVVVIGVGVVYLFSPHLPVKTGGSPLVVPVGGAQTPPTTSTATNYDECIAEGNKPLPDAPDKCLTADGHVFVQGVIEE